MAFKLKRAVNINPTNAEKCFPLLELAQGYSGYGNCPEGRLSLEKINNTPYFGVLTSKDMTKKVFTSLWNKDIGRHGSLDIELGKNTLRMRSNFDWLIKFG